MIVEFKTETGAIFHLDRDFMTWERNFNGRITHGKLFTWPYLIAIGHTVGIFDVKPGTQIGVCTQTAKVVSINTVMRDEPNVAAGVKPAAAV
jgi:hypothetical protein